MNATVLDCDSPKFLRSKKPLVLARQTIAGYKTELVAMPRGAFQALPSCAYQRDDETRARTVKHLEEMSPIHSVVLMTRVGKELAKLDGHTRTAKWAAGSLEGPDVVWGLVIQCRDIEDVKRFYDQVDNLQAAERAKDKMFGQMRASGYIPTNCPFFREGNYVTAIRVCTGASSKGRLPRALMEVALPYVRAIAERVALPKSISPMLVGAALSVLRKYDGDARVADELAEFLQAVLAKDGSYDRNSRLGDAVALLERELAKLDSKTGAKGQRQVFNLALGAMRLWLEAPEAVHTAEDLQPMTVTELSDELPARFAALKPRESKSAVQPNQVKRDAQTGALGRTAVSRTQAPTSSGRRSAARPITLLGLGAAR